MKNSNKDDKYLVYRADIQNPKIKTYLFTTTDLNSVMYLNDYIYFKNDTLLTYNTKLEQDSSSSTFKYIVPNYEKLTLLILCDTWSGSSSTTITPDQNICGFNYFRARFWHFFKKIIWQKIINSQTAP